ncbi:LysR family transcriptional regulator [Nonomuraea sp. NPDC049158]|uniref:LysR family transcriptional regulator n=1 Tax=Nonomuraea sp. NPDC049158 TaxID=3155649 RepID=UPI0033C9E1BA
MELRDIEIFLTLADELHFGRTAQRLHLTTARVSQAIKKQERALGAALFDRTSRTVRLTPFGRQLREDLRPIYLTLADTVRRAKDTALGRTARLSIGMMPVNAHELRPFWDAFRARHPHCELRLRHASFVDPFAGLRSGEIDILVTWLPVEEPDLSVGPILFKDRRVLAVAADHELAPRASASVEDIAFYQHSGARRTPGYWEDSFIPFHTPRGRTIERGPLVANMDELLSLVSNGEIVNLLPAHSTRYWPRPDIVWLPITDMEPLAYGIVWRTETENDLIRAFAQVITDLGAPAL